MKETLRILILTVYQQRSYAWKGVWARWRPHRKIKEITSMRDVDVYADLLEALSAWGLREIAELSATELAWQPDAEGNNIAVTVWHFSRWLDVLARVFQAQDPRAEVWIAQGWAARTGYNPQGIGYLGLGVVTGYTQAEVAAVPLLPAPELLSYLDQVCGALSRYLRALPSLAALDEPISERWPTPRLRVLREVLMGSCGHLGEVEALKAMMQRAGK
jgi:hypothetical protein